MVCPETEGHIRDRVRAVVDSLEVLEGNILLVTHGQTGFVHPHPCTPDSFFPHALYSTQEDSD